MNARLADEWKEIDSSEVEALVTQKAGLITSATIPDGAVPLMVGEATEEIKNIIHQPYVPAGLKYVLADRACGKLIGYLYSTGKITDAGGAVTSVRVGDTQISYSAGQNIETAITDLQKAGEKELLRYRKLCF